MSPKEPPDDPDETRIGAFRTDGGRVRRLRLLSKRNVLWALILLFLLVLVIGCLLRL